MQKASSVQQLVNMKDIPKIEIEKMLFLSHIDLDDQLAPARNAIGETEYKRLYQEGKSMNVEQAVALILGQ
jgi:hypothetical protein